MNKHLVAVIIWGLLLAGSGSAVMFSNVDGVRMFFGFAAFIMIFALYDSIQRLQK